MGRRPKYKEPTKDVTVTLPQTAIQNLDALAAEMGLNGRSELIARIGLGDIALSSDWLGNPRPTDRRNRGSVG